jgi:hypothetical protein
MTMSRKDYQMLARVFRQSLDNNADLPDAGNVTYRSTVRAGILHTLVVLCDELARDNQNFDRRTFLFAATGSHDMHLSLLESEGV